MKHKKSLGQNFFNNLNLAKKIVTLVCSTDPRRIIEIGPGMGSFTNLLKDTVEKLTVIEKDTELSEMLKASNPNVEVVNSDFLEYEIPSEYVSGETVCFGSLPYNVSKKIIQKVIEHQPQFMNSYFIIQKEVAVKYTQSESSVLSIMTKLYANSKVLFDIQPGSFTPRPKVVSSFIHFTPNKNLEQIEDVDEFSKFIKQAFGNPRKMLRNNLSTYKIEDANTLSRRPGSLSFLEYVNLFNSLK